jgi:hypothetical protein
VITGFLDILKKHNASENGSDSVLWGGGGRRTLLRPVERANLNHLTAVDHVEVEVIKKIMAAQRGELI